MGIILYIDLAQLRDNLFGLMALLRHPGPPVCQKTYFRLTNSARVDQETAIATASTAVCLPGHAVNGIAVKALATGNGSLMPGPSRVSAVIDGTDNGYVLARGELTALQLTMS
ncbi:hypothetical protein GGC47_004478 [Bosea sp. OAE752]|uniref:hypothetical protein n=1 Tax=Bosea sp. OAE752 TaxID=2663873 RepID=UPI003D1A4780